ncbi:MAG: peptidoglycan DD-metalloendopeptidase family protein [Ignavibacteria bacterium]|nr:peptidoglycan DD-metalloendopeptidase family protein [Ignavibacteria bacterium]MBT8381562.1 peptidoglycan DD-metalloendopeptidase family protein [Ignavibacteria bacterium]MBT8391890.1 peptidoglycan DD-metalloendopeptidase family protein [Ignavibacteria bacterium]NNL22236.1 peptidoglycan DD-metalloendopeptidase family protein [Ignavibacteriaceae bacterium]
MVTYSKYILIALLFTILTYPQDSKISEKEVELGLIKQEIRELEQELIEKSAAEKKSFEAIENLSRQSHLLNKAINSLQKIISEKGISVSRLENKIDQIENEIDIIKDNYAKYVVAIYKKGAYNELEALVDASSLQQAVLRLHYLQEFAEKREKDLENLKLKKNELLSNQKKLISEQKEKLELVGLKNNENINLRKKLTERKQILNSIQNDNKELRKLLSAKKNSQKQIEELIVKLVEAERIREETEINKVNQIASEKKMETEDRNSGIEYDFNTSTFSSFSNLKGKMIMPLHNGKIIRRFGENKNKKLNTVTLNYGIDIEAKSDKNVRCVGEGFVSAIDWLPGYGNVIIVSHKDNYRTVYGHLSEIFVAEGDRVKSGAVLAKVDETIEGEILHFEIWNSRDKQNPELWLAKK